ncbi:hypothetical protein MCOR27_001236 [Pyricularia oryzae]|uniref:t-SNARE coiled-coil homology domain-containing protein n=4 Tax=Pyricularia TaxID=48558 RepID=A0ABQ8NGW3_PYRGI|nr:hypothetical protein OOU_Y34scaffold00462g24 [Pyricularia oryzae Y34]KAH8840361.1 hypothetical protein MCOR01_007075 [Pyricularia oryzae]KAI6296866.1 hypothetical protein MCOR33_006667 [Pyricularia grisea]KAH9434349.1 hypothetical protein MCOR02_006361 [Pyricularia oryzae]KAI6256998.1 hypothetical protein MCOR19_006577 [Pyricularia oryzae]
MSYNNQQQYGGNPYGQAPATEAGYGYGNGGNEHEMQQYGQPQQQQQYGQGQNGYGYGHGQQQQEPAGPPVMSQQDFLGQVTFTRGEINRLTSDVQTIATLHSRSLQGGDAGAQQQLEQQIAETSRRTTSIRTTIKQLKKDVEHTQDGSRSIKERQWNTLNDTFKQELRNYIQEEQRYKEGYREQIARQYRIVNPDASEDEVRRAADQNWGDEGVFQQALRQNRAAQGQAVLGAVRARHNEMRQIEDSIVELAKMFEDLDTLVIQQEPIVQRVEQQAEDTTQNLNHANTEVKKAADHAKNRRKLKWWCLGITTVIIIAIIVAIVAAGFTQCWWPSEQCKKRNGNTQ